MLARRLIIVVVPVLLLLPGVARAAPVPELHYSSSVTATAFWLLQALSGDPNTQSAAWRKSLQDRGLLREGDEAFVQRYAKLRQSYLGHYLRRPTRPNPWLPVPPPAGHRLEVRMAAMFLGARTLDDVLSRAEVLMPDEDVRELAAVLHRLQPVIEQVHRDGGDLAGMTKTFASDPAHSKLMTLLEGTARLLGVPDGAVGKVRVNLVPAPPKSAFPEGKEILHGRRLGNDVVIEVRPDDVPKRRLDVVGHELVHYLQDRAGLADDPVLLDALFAAGPEAGLAWEALNEGLATALGQGVLQGELDPALLQTSLGKPASWYVDDDLDAFAKALYPLVKAALADGRTLTALAPGIVQAWRQARAGKPETPRTVLMRHAIALGPSAQGVLATWQEVLPARSVWRLSLGEVPTMAAKHRALSMVVAGTPADRAEMSVAAAALGLAMPARGKDREVIVKRRTGGGWAVLVVARDADGVAALLREVAGLAQLSERPAPARGEAKR